MRFDWVKDYGCCMKRFPEELVVAGGPLEKPAPKRLLWLAAREDAPLVPAVALFGLVGLKL